MQPRIAIIPLTAICTLFLCLIAYGQTIPLEYNTDRLGSDYSNFDVVNDPNSCAQACKDDPNCKAFTFVKPGYQGTSARCWLKSAVPQKTQADCCVSGVKSSDQMDLTGVWGCNDGAIYYIRQIGNKIWWYGETNRNSPNWANVFYGTMSGNRPGDVITGNWADVPKGKTSHSGTLRIMIETDNKLATMQQTGGFSGTSWTRPI